MLERILAWLFLSLASFFYLARGLIAGYNTPSKEERAKYDKKWLCRFMGKIMLVLAGGSALWAVSVYIQSDWLLYVGLFLYLGAVAFALMYTNTKKRFKK